MTEIREHKGLSQDIMQIIQPESSPFSFLCTSDIFSVFFIYGGLPYNFISIFIRFFPPVVLHLQLFHFLIVIENMEITIFACLNRVNPEYVINMYMNFFSWFVHFKFRNSSRFLTNMKQIRL